MSNEVAYCLKNRICFGKWLRFMVLSYKQAAHRKSAGNCMLGCILRDGNRERKGGKCGVPAEQVKF